MEPQAESSSNTSIGIVLGVILGIIVVVLVLFATGVIGGNKEPAAEKEGYELNIGVEKNDSGADSDSGTNAENQ
ncbi:MAG: hypothetical protein A2928_01570 [Candidatus Taylorbacteria bacterium RIFCSPLOWO2_01_FULL_45_15b]|uniref:Uncharacterized protein n=1 Tax=Candidatus Taylorbacteria bacterium RIFCSPLOWO2_01_FULL_45_15b TaxID=1802319 RepID=A0A1G2NDV2_9BACT|nr:MAG: hypothetical protein A2928_01570 [Candidatus Taylorbacteria bacterium RIFCSPLOWO2_01_FULL_45_15b]